MGQIYIILNLNYLSNRLVCSSHIITGDGGFDFQLIIICKFYAKINISSFGSIKVQK